MAAITDVQIVRRIQKESATDAPLLNLRVTNEESRTVMITPLSSQDHLITVLLCRIPADVKTKVNKHVQLEAMETSPLSSVMRLWVPLQYNFFIISKGVGKYKRKEPGDRRRLLIVAECRNDIGNS